MQRYISDTRQPIPNHAINLWCLKDILEPRKLACGCPLCCAELGLTAVFQVEDFEVGVYPLGWWPKSVCSEKLALLVRERICPGWPGSTWKEGKRVARGGASSEGP